MESAKSSLNSGETEHSANDVHKSPPAISRITTRAQIQRQRQLNQEVNNSYSQHNLPVGTTKKSTVSNNITKLSQLQSSSRRDRNRSNFSAGKGSKAIKKKETGAKADTNNSKAKSNQSKTTKKQDTLIVTDIEYYSRIARHLRSSRLDQQCPLERYRQWQYYATNVMTSLLESDDSKLVIDVLRALNAVTRSTAQTGSNNLSSRVSDTTTKTKDNLTSSNQNDSNANTIDNNNCSTDNNAVDLNDKDMVDDVEDSNRTNSKKTQVPFENIPLQLSGSDSFEDIKLRLENNSYLFSYEWQTDVRILFNKIFSSYSSDSAEWAAAARCCVFFEFLCVEQYQVNPYAKFESVKSSFNLDRNSKKFKSNNGNNTYYSKSMLSTKRTLRSKPPTGVIIRDSGSVVYTASCYGTPLALYYENNFPISNLPPPVLSGASNVDNNVSYTIFASSKKNFYTRFKKLDVKYRLALLNWLKDELGIHPVLCALDIRYLPEFDLVPIIKARSLFAYLRTLLITQKTAQEEKLLSCNLPFYLNWSVKYVPSDNPEPTNLLTSITEQTDNKITLSPLKRQIIPEQDQTLSHASRSIPHKTHSYHSPINTKPKIKQDDLNQNASSDNLPEQHGLTPITLAKRQVYYNQSESSSDDDQCNIQSYLLIQKINVHRKHPSAMFDSSTILNSKNWIKERLAKLMDDPPSDMN